MKYWFYSEGNILGPYDPAEMLALPAFAEESLVCPETATGDNPGDWRPASQVAEIASALSFGSGRTITAGVVAGAYEYETGFNSSARYFEDKEPSTGANYGELLDTIDNILGAYKEGPSARAVPETDYDLAEKFTAYGVGAALAATLAIYLGAGELGLFGLGHVADLIYAGAAVQPLSAAVLYWALARFKKHRIPG